MAATESMDRLVALFLQSAMKEGEAASMDDLLTPEGIERAVEGTRKMLNGDEALRMGASCAPTFVCLGMALEEKPKTHWAALRCYKEALIHLGSTAKGSWERVVVLQQMGTVCLRHDDPERAVEYLTHCTQECKQASGHPRDAVLFNGSFSTSQTRLEFSVMVEKLLAQAYHKMGDMTLAHSHMKEAQHLEAMSGGDAVERSVAQAAEKVAASGGTLAAPQFQVAACGLDLKKLWAASPDDERRLKRYGFTDEGPTICLMLDLNEHMDFPGTEASDLVESLKQFRVVCEPDSVDIRLRTCQDGGPIREFRLFLEPLAHEIVPEDTVPKLKGREGKRRLEVKLFKRDKTKSWFGDLVRSEVTKAIKKGGEAASRIVNGEANKPAAVKSVPAPRKGTALNPLTPEEMAKLPKPGGSAADNRPSAFMAANKTTPAPEQKESAGVDGGYLFASDAPKAKEVVPSSVPMENTCDGFDEMD